MFKATLIAVALAAAGASAASAQGYRAQNYGNGGYNHNGGYQGSDGGLGRYCPPGYYPQSFPGGNGVRCVAGDSKIYSAPF